MSCLVSTHLTASTRPPRDRGPGRLVGLFTGPGPGPWSPVAQSPCQSQVAFSATRSLVRPRGQGIGWEELAEEAEERDSLKVSEIM